MPPPSEENQSPLAAGMAWAYRIFAAVLVMVGPGLAGQWLDRRWDTGFIGLVGFAFGLTSGIAYLVTVTRPKSSTDGLRQDGQSPKKL